jgi:hypothetical protein
MLYQKNKGDTFSEELFREPTAEYRGTPFWAWNCELDKDELLWQIERLKEMGFGGFHMHSRCGMATEYLGDEFMGMVKACTDKAEKENMLAWLYDEDRWPSGAAGGYVTSNPAYRAKRILFTARQIPSVSKDEGVRTGKPYFLAAFDIEFSQDGKLISYRRIGEDEEGQNKWYVYVDTFPASGWFNGQAYIDALSEQAVDEFIRVTYDAYERAVGDRFGSVVPAMFTDEPQIPRMNAPALGTDKSDTRMSWTTDLADTYRAAYGEDIVDFLPELRWERADGKVSLARYRYHDHVCERFAAAFCDRCGKWCDEHGILFTGHMNAESTLESQTMFSGEVMRTYRSFGLPGIDMLANRLELSTAKQTQSAVHQFDREGMLSELYGVTGWTFDFRGHKFQGDWQAALGVTVRVPHLSWVSMKGSAKRDYPASIHYQSPWYKEYKMIEDHFARVNTVMTRGKPLVRIGVIHPIESFWLHFGPIDATSAVRAEMEQNFEKIISHLLFHSMDFDFISEGLLPSQYEPNEDKALHVGAMAYDAVIVPNLETMRSTTLKILTEFKNRGGKLIFLGDCPKYVDAVASDEVRVLYDSSIHFGSASMPLLDALRDEREVMVTDHNGAYPGDFVYQLRTEGEKRYFFLAHAEKEPVPDVPRTARKLAITFKGMWKPLLLDTFTGRSLEIPYECKNGKTVVSRYVDMSDSLLLVLTPAGGESHIDAEPQKERVGRMQDLKTAVSYRREEDNVLLLDMAEWSKDGVNFEPTEEILRIDMALRAVYGYPLADGRDKQPWVITPEPITEFPTLRFTFESEIEAPVRLAYEEACEVIFNGEKTEVSEDGYYVDKSIHTMPLGTLKKGTNELIVRVPFGKRLSIEYFYLLGDFDVSVEGCRKTVLAPSRQISFGDVTSQGLPFYGGNLIYETEWETPACDAELRISRYRGALIRVFVDGEDKGAPMFAPYTAGFKLSEGKHRIEIKLYGNRANTFDCLHNCDEGENYRGPMAWYSKDSRFSYDYNLNKFGILNSPVLTVYPETK